MSMRKKFLFWVFFVAALSFLTVPSVVLFDNLKAFFASAPEESGLRPSRVDFIPHRGPPSAPGAESDRREDRAKQQSAEAAGTTEALKPSFIRFSLDAPKAKKVSVAGDFNLWRTEQFVMKKKGSRWTLVVPMPPGRHRYRFLVDGEWKVDPANPEREKQGNGEVSVKVVP
jgi:hypothetical protein